VMMFASISIIFMWTAAYISPKTAGCWIILQYCYLKILWDAFRLLAIKWFWCRPARLRD
jgi:hypothetical protein